MCDDERVQRQLIDHIINSVSTRYNVQKYTDCAEELVVLPLGSEVNQWCFHGSTTSLAI